MLAGKGLPLVACGCLKQTKGGTQQGTESQAQGKTKKTIRAADSYHIEIGVQKKGASPMIPIGRRLHNVAFSGS
jgi:hypothetical protein